MPPGNASALVDDTVLTVVVNALDPNRQKNVTWPLMATKFVFAETWTVEFELVDPAELRIVTLTGGAIGIGM